MSPLDDLAFFRQLAQSDSPTVTARELGVSLPQAHPQRIRVFAEFLATAMQGRVPAQPGVA